MLPRIDIYYELLYKETERMKKIKVLMVGGAMNVGGQENQIVNVIRYADKMRFQIDYTTTVENPFYRQEIESLGGHCIRIPDMDWTCPWIYCKELSRVIKEGKYDIVHGHELFHTGITLMIAAKAKVPVRIAHSHSGSDGDGIRRTLVRRVYNRIMRFLILHYATELIACSSVAGEFLYGKKALNRSNYHLIFNSVDTQSFMKPYGKIGSLCSEIDWKCVLHVGHMIPLKNQDFLVDIAAVLRDRGSKIRIYSVGPGNNKYINYVEKKIKENKLENQIVLLGLRKDVPDLMRKADAFVLPSRYEGMPLVMIEAQAAGLPCIAADTFSREVDFGTGQIRWLGLDLGAEVWADELTHAVNKKRANKEQIEHAIERFGFDSHLFAKAICNIYEDALK